MTTMAVDSLVLAIRAVEDDLALTEAEKAKKRQELMSGIACEGKNKSKMEDSLAELIKCSFCLDLPEKPVTTPCGHNFCLKCFKNWILQGKRTCANCRKNIPESMARHPLINMTMVAATRIVKESKNDTAVYRNISNDQRPDTSFTTERAKLKGNANAACGRTFVTIPHEHFGPITSEYDPTRNQGVLVGEEYRDRQHCKQWGVHRTHMSGICGQSAYGAQSVALSGVYGVKAEEDDHGEWFIYSGSGGRDLSGNKRTNQKQSWNQEFTKRNQALRISCLKGYPVRVVRSWKYKGSSYTPKTGVRYDGIYRVEKCWKTVGNEGFNVCRFLFVRCDNEPAPWTSDQHGERPTSVPDVPEMHLAFEVTERTESPHWGFDETRVLWTWLKPPPPRRKVVSHIEGTNKTRRATNKLLKDFGCVICKQVLNQPVTTTCAHNFCKLCIEKAFGSKSLVRERNHGGRNLRSRKNVILCPSCPTDISDILNNLQVNMELMEIIKLEKEKLQYHENAIKEELDQPENGQEEKKVAKGGSETVVIGERAEQDTAITTLEQEHDLKRKDLEPYLFSDDEILVPEFNGKKQKGDAGESSNST